jgi:glycerate-2-kinase
LHVCKQQYNLKNFKKIICVGFGKVALSAVTEIQKILRDKITCGFVIDLKEGNLGNIICQVGTHPYPTVLNVKATKQLVGMLEECEKEDLVICVVSGGGSALLCDPYDMTCEEQSKIISALTTRGASITELNIVRKHISNVKGGNLAKIVYPATCISLIFSDVPGNDLSIVASGPTVFDISTVNDAKKILVKFSILENLKINKLKLIETPKEKKYFENINNFLVVSPKHALLAMRERALEFGYEVKIYSDKFQGEAKKLGPEIVSLTSSKGCLLGAGESTVKILGKGKGGRNQEMALAAIPFLKKDQVFVCFASDGYDNTEVGGAVVDVSTKDKALNLGLDINESLNNNDSFTFFETVGEQVQTGLTNINISDIFISLKG